MTLSLVEFASNSVREKVLKSFGDNFEFNSTTIKISRAKTQPQRSRNWAMREAAKLVGAGDDDIDWGKKATDMRSIKKGGSVAFVQTKSDLRGSFQPGFTHLALPA